MAGEPKKITRLYSGDLLVEVSQRSHSTNLLRATRLANIPVLVSKHKTLNSKKGVIRCRDLKYCDDQEILEGLVSQHVTEIFHIKISKDGNKVPTGTFILTFDVAVLPKEVRVGYMNVPVTTYIPNPVRCYKCQRFDHHKNNCKNLATCAKCGKTDHAEETCMDDPHCVNCNGTHPSYSKDCLKWTHEKEIQKLKHTLNLSFGSWSFLCWGNQKN